MYPFINPNSWMQTADPDQSFIVFTNESGLGMTTCAVGDGPVYQYLKVTVKDSSGGPMANISSSSFEFTVAPDIDTQFYGNLSCTFTAVGMETDVNGELCFEIVGDTSIVGNITVGVSVDDITLNAVDVLQCNSVDMNCDGTVSLSDIVLFSGIYHNDYDYRADFYWDGVINLSDLVRFSQHYGHHN